MPDRTTTLTCDNCDRRLGERRGNTLVAGRFDIQMKRTHNIECSYCGVYTTFEVSRPEKQFDKTAIKTENRN